MTWHMVGPRGARRDLWVRATGLGKPERGRWRTPTGLDVYTVLRQTGPAGLDIDVCWEQEQDSRGTTVTDLLWQTHVSGLKIGSARLADVLRSHCPSVQTMPVQVRLRGGDPVDGFVGFLEPENEAAPVHSLRRGRRGPRFIVSEAVASDLRRADLNGLHFDAVAAAFPADELDWDAG